MTELKFCLTPGHIMSETDGDIHYIGYGQLVELYGLRPGQWQPHRHYGPSCIHLSHLAPRWDGKYQRVN